jgi:hypothetical protein
MPPVVVPVLRASQPGGLVDAAAEMGRKCAELQAIIIGERETLSCLQQHGTVSAASAGVALRRTRPLWRQLQCHNGIQLNHI